ncbi:MAG TPA: hypothetical protein PKW24_04440, partial [Clostridiales bacterium]|nr:hypothetical protein [Clostridiales bacterium]
MVNVAVLGVGNRGYEYSLFVKNFHKKRAQLVALCDSNPIRLTEAAKALKVPDENCYKSDEEFFA